MKKMKKILARRSMAVLLTAVLAMTSASVPVAAAEPAGSIMDSILSDAIKEGNERTQLYKKTGNPSLLWDTSYFNPDPSQTEGRRRASKDDMPAKFDLREEGYVTPVKLQNPFSTCWGFATIAAAESSILSETKRKYDKDTNDLDLSELHLAWFALHALPKDSDTGQGGEGTYPGPRTYEGLAVGGNMYYGTTAFASGMGPRSEKDIPYQPKDPKNHIYTDKDGFSYYHLNADWSVDESERFGIGVELEESSLLPSPASYTDDGEGEYVYNEEGTNAIKEELMEGRAVSIAFCADTSVPGQGPGGTRIDLDNWAHFTYDEDDLPNHAVTIVGWDDTYAASNFLAEVNGKEVPQPDGPGAWIVKNSWGAISNDFPHKSRWGIDGEGYFYLSYYDRSISIPETFDFFTEGTGYDKVYVNQYDFMTARGIDIHESDKEVREANVFHAEDGDMTLRSVAATTSEAGAEITYQIYRLKDDYASPTDGTLLETIKKTYQYAGYHRENLKTEQHFRKGEHYSVVVTQESDGKYLYGAASGFSKSWWENWPEGTRQSKSYSVGVINEGESFLGSKSDSGEEKWMDWKDFTWAYIEGTNSDLTLDNFAIKTYSDPYDGFASQAANLSTALNKKVRTAWKGKKLKARWGKAKDADGYDVYAAKCGSKWKKVKTIKKNSMTNATIGKIGGKKLNEKKDYKVAIKAYRKVNGKKVHVATSCSMHVAGPANKTYTNAKKLTPAKKSVTVEAGKTKKASVKITKSDKKKKLLGKAHGAKLRYFSTDKKIATVSKAGKIKGINKGTCTVYILAANGTKATVKVTVK